MGLNARNEIFTRTQFILFRISFLFYTFILTRPHFFYFIIHHEERSRINVLKYVKKDRQALWYLLNIF